MRLASHVCLKTLTEQPQKTFERHKDKTMARRRLSTVGILMAAVATLALGTGTATAASKTTGNCVNASFCYTQGYMFHDGAGDIAIDGDLTHAPGATVTFELFTSGGQPVCTIGPIPESAPAGSWICPNVTAAGPVDVRGLTGGPHGDIFVQARL